MNVIRIGLLGCGVVGGGVVEALHQNAQHIAGEAGAQFRIVSVAVRDLNRDRVPHVDKDWLVTDWQEVVLANDVDVVVEAIGGIYPAYDAVKAAILQGKHVVTANKELLAKHGGELLALAERKGTEILYEASVLGGIPAIHALQTYFFANRIETVRGIVNGTSNYILSKMDEEGQSFGEALVAAQRAGYAEADPTLDVEGYDALYKLQILARLALGVDLDVAAIPRTGIIDVEPIDTVLAAKLGCRIRHVAYARRTEDERVVDAGVRPMLVTKRDALYHVSGVQNALVVTADIVGDITLSGPGAGAFPTASAIVEDLVKLAKSGVDKRRRWKSAGVVASVPDTVVLRRHYQHKSALAQEVTLRLKRDFLVDGVLYMDMPEHKGELWVISKERADSSRFLDACAWLESLQAEGEGFLTYELASQERGRQPAVWFPDLAEVSGLNSI